MSYDRRYSVYIDGEPFVLCDDGRQLRINFTVSANYSIFHTTADIAIYNLKAESTDNFIKVGSTIALSAGYVGNEGGIYSGRVNHVLKERVGTETITRVLSYSGTRSDVLMTQTFGVNTPVTDIIQACATVAGYPLVWTEADFSDEPLYTAGLTVAGFNAVDTLAELGQRHGFQTIIDGGKLVVVKIGKQKAGQPIEISESTGMEGIPEVTWIGADVATRLNPALAIGGTIDIKASLQTFNMANFYHSQVAKGTGQGLYVIDKLEHEGDNWGDVWSSKITGRRKDG